MDILVIKCFLVWLFACVMLQMSKADEEVAVLNVDISVPEPIELAEASPNVEQQDEQTNAARKTRQFGFPPPPGYGFGYPPPRPVGYGGGFGGGYGGGFGGGVQRTRIVTRTRVVNRYGGFGGGGYGGGGFGGGGFYG